MQDCTQPYKTVHHHTRLYNHTTPRQYKIKFVLSASYFVWLSVNFWFFELLTQLKTKIFLKANLSWIHRLHILGCVCLCTEHNKSPHLDTRTRLFHGRYSCSLLFWFCSSACREPPHIQIPTTFYPGYPRHI